ncbi:MAG: hypothetical protein Q9227_008668 [Pyrenula ochraceoflavens]
MFGSTSGDHRNSIIKGPPSKQRQRRLKKTSKFTSGISWGLSALSILLVLLITTGGTSLDKGGSPSDSSITGEAFSILSVTIPFKDVAEDGSLAWTLQMFLSAGCARPVKHISSDVGPSCLYNVPGRTFDVHELLVDRDNWVKDFEVSVRHFNEYKLPTKTTENTHPKTVETALPFGLYMASMVFSALLLATLPRGCCGIKWFFGRKLLNLLLSLASLAFTTAASAILTVKLLNLKSQLNTPEFQKYVSTVTIGKTWLGLTYGSMILMFLAAILLTIEFVMEDRHITRDNGIMGIFRRKPTFMRLPTPEEDEKHLTLEMSNRSRRPSAASDLPLGSHPPDIVLSAYEPYRQQAVDPRENV